MKIRQLALAGALALASATAFAYHCPADMKKIDAALDKNPSMTADLLNEVKRLRAEGERMHNAGKHQEAVDALAKAMKALGVQ